MEKITFYNKHNYLSNKHLLDKVETNIKNDHACEINSGRRRRHDNFHIDRDRVQISVLVSPYLLKP